MPVVLNKELHVAGNHFIGCSKFLQEHAKLWAAALPRWRQGQLALARRRCRQVKAAFTACRINCWCAGLKKTDNF